MKEKINICLNMREGRPFSHGLNLAGCENWDNFFYKLLKTYQNKQSKKRKKKVRHVLFVKQAQTKLLKKSHNLQLRAKQTDESLWHTENKNDYKKNKVTLKSSTKKHEIVLTTGDIGAASVTAGLPKPAPNPENTVKQAYVWKLSTTNNLKSPTLD